MSKRVSVEIFVYTSKSTLSTPLEANYKSFYNLFFIHGTFLEASNGVKFVALLFDYDLSRTQFLTVHFVSVAENFCHSAGVSRKFVRLPRSFVDCMVYLLADFAEPFDSVPRKDVQKLVTYLFDAAAPPGIHGFPRG